MKPTKNTMIKAQSIIDYIATYPDTYIIFYANNIILNIDSDVVYLVSPKVRNTVTGYFQLACLQNVTEHPRLNGAALNK